MAIQFICPSCGQPIEVDDELANELVTCPFCSEAATAPAKTDLTPGSPAVAPPAATPSPPGMDYAPAGAPAPGSPPRWASVCAWISLACVLGSFFLMVAAALLLGDFLKELQTATDPAETQELIGEAVKSQPLGMVSYLCGTCVVPLAGIVLAIVALIGHARTRWPAITTLCVFGAGVLILLANLVCS